MWRVFGNWGIDEYKSNYSRWKLGRLNINSKQLCVSVVEIKAIPSWVSFAGLYRPPKANSLIRKKWSKKQQYHQTGLAWGGRYFPSTVNKRKVNFNYQKPPFPKILKMFFRKIYSRFGKVPFWVRGLGSLHRGFWQLRSPSPKKIIEYFENSYSRFGTLPIRSFPIPVEPWSCRLSIFGGFFYTFGFSGSHHPPTLNIPKREKFSGCENKENSRTWRLVMTRSSPWLTEAWGVTFSGENVMRELSCDEQDKALGFQWLGIVLHLVTRKMCDPTPFN